MISGTISRFTFRLIQLVPRSAKYRKAEYRPYQKPLAKRVQIAGLKEMKRSLGSYKCPTCGERFQTKKQYIRHAEYEIRRS